MTIKALYPTVYPSLDLNFARTKALDPRITYTRASTGTFVGSNGLIQTAASGVPRFDCNPTTGESLGLLMEVDRTNEFTNSNPWTGGSNVTWTSSQVSPTGKTEAYNMVETTANNIHGLSILGGFAADYNRYISVFAKSAGRRYLVFWAALGAYPGADAPECIFDLQSGTVTYLDVNGSAGIFKTASITNFGNGWYRCGIYLNPSSLANRTLYMLMSNSASSQQSSYTGDGSSGITLFGLQLEIGSFPTSYIPTVASTVTRAADVASMTGTNFSSWYNQSSGTVVANVLASQGTRPSIAAASVLGITPSVGFLPGNLIYQNSDSNGIWYTADSGILELVLTINLNPNGNKFAWGLTAGASSVAVKDGVTRGNYSWSSITRTGFLIGTENNGFIRWKSLTYYPVRLPDAQLQALTAT
jgi:hypothetical protein